MRRRLILIYRPGGVTTSEPEIDYPKYDIDLGGEDFNILFFDAVKACGWSSDIPCDVDVAEQTGDVLSDAVYTRNRKIEDMYNLKIKAYDSGRRRVGVLYGAREIGNVRFRRV